MTKRPIKSFTGLRYGMVLLLYLHHLDMFADLNIPGYPQAMRYLTEGYVSVDFFFVLSGFVVTYSYLPRLQQGETQAAEFLFRRWSKLYPTHLLLWGIAVALYGGWGGLWSNFTSKQFWGGVFLLQSYVPVEEYAFWGNGVSWSVSAQMFFYIAFVFLAKLSHKDRKHIFLFLLGVILYTSIFVGTGTPVAGWFYYINPVFRLLDFLAGMLLCEWVETIPWRPASRTSASFLEAAALLLLAAFMLMQARFLWAQAVRLRSYYYLLPCLVLLFTFFFEQGMLSQLFQTKIIQVLGGSAFEFYMVHQIVLYLVKRLCGAYMTNLPRMALCALGGLTVAQLLALALHYGFSRPVDRYLRAWWKEKSALKLREGN